MGCLEMLHVTCQVITASLPLKSYKLFKIKHLHWKLINQWLSLSDNLSFENSINFKERHKDIFNNSTDCWNCSEIIIKFAFPTKEKASLTQCQLLDFLYKL